MAKSATLIKVQRVICVHAVKISKRKQTDLKFSFVEICVFSTMTIGTVAIKPSCALEPPRMVFKQD